jgi:hypothetical protein
MYFSQLLENIRKDNDINNLFMNIINPFSTYLICDHYIGSELKELNIKVPIFKNDLLATNNTDVIKDYDILLVESIQFDIFIETFLPRIKKKIVLITGYWQWPQIYKSEKTDYVLNHPNILLWISQNPIYQDHPKYMPFPYGICHCNLIKYAEQLLLENNKTKMIEFLPIQNGTNPCRSKLPELEKMKPEEYYKKMGEAQFLLSPIGDRDDCYRHYECIGLGTIPISNIGQGSCYAMSPTTNLVDDHRSSDKFGETYKPIFNENMYYCDIDQMVTILDTGVIDCSYSMPNRDLICFEYHRDMVFNRIAELRSKYGHYPSFSVDSPLGLSMENRRFAPPGGSAKRPGSVRKFKMCFM